jgi:hypothetical protein
VSEQQRHTALAAIRTVAGLATILLVFEAFDRTNGGQGPLEMFLAAIAGGFVAGHRAVVWAIGGLFAVAMVYWSLFDRQEHAESSEAAQIFMATAVVAFLAVGAIAGLKLAGLVKRTMRYLT